MLSFFSLCSHYLSHFAHLGTRSSSKSSDVAILCYEGDGTTSLKEILEANKNAASVAVIIGSEGGFSVSEAAFARDEGLYMANLGKRILRCETAPAFALSAITYFYEL